MREEAEQGHGWSKQKGEEQRAKGEALFCSVLRRGLFRCSTCLCTHSCQFNSIHLLLSN